MSAGNGPTAAGSWRVAVVGGGAGAGLQGASVGGRVGLSGVEATGWVSDSSVVCGVGGGAGGSMRVAMTVGQAAGSVSGMGSMDVAGVSGGGRTNGGWRGGPGSVAVGAGGGVWDGGWSGGARAGGSACESSAWLSETGVVCRGSVGRGGSVGAVVTVGAAAGTSTMLLSADSGVAWGPGVNAGGSQGVWATLTGGWMLGEAGRVASGMVRAGSSRCEGSVWASDTAVACGVSGGTGGSGMAAVTVGAQVGSGSRAVSYDAGGVSGVDGTANVAADSGGVVWAGAGAGWRGVWYSGGARSGWSASGGTAWRSATSVVVRWSRGLSGSAGLMVSVGVSAGGSVSGAASYDRGGLMGASKTERSGAGSGAVVTVGGAGLGGADHSVGVRLGGSGSEGTWWVSDSAAWCRAWSGVSGRSLQVVATAGAQVGLSLTEAMSYDGAAAGRRELGNTGAGSTTLGAGVVLEGRMLERGSGSSMAARSGGTGCEATVWAGDSGVVCRGGKGGGSSLAVAATAGLVVGTMAEAWSVDVAVVSGASGTNGGSGGGEGGATVVVVGLGLGLGDGSGTGRAGGSGCESSLWTSDTSARCLVGRGGAGSSRGVSVTVSGTDGSLSGAVSFDVGGGVSGVGGEGNGAGRGDAGLRYT